MDEFKIHDTLMEKLTVLRYPKDRWTKWVITDEDVFHKDKTPRWGLREVDGYGRAVYGKNFVKDHYFKYDPAIEIIYG